ncbi:hypothetical protein [Helicobacter vulpis]|uniref:hypothetical protein n=1 Tax=Helicobacter vulpis TaxID=2316076 RepID=UPI000EB4E024|nr:hypothetical protein [Helicobacter vulpis]
MSEKQTLLDKARELFKNNNTDSGSISELEKALEYAEKTGDHELIEKIKAQLQHLHNLKQLLMQQQKQESKGHSR